MPAGQSPYAERALQRTETYEEDTRIGWPYEWDRCCGRFLAGNTSQNFAPETFVNPDHCDRNANKNQRRHETIPSGPGNGPDCGVALASLVLATARLSDLHHSNRTLRVLPFGQTIARGQHRIAVASGTGQPGQGVTMPASPTPQYPPEPVGPHLDSTPLQIKDILLATDFSSQATEAAKVASGLDKFLQGKLHVLHAVPLQIYGADSTPVLQKLEVEDARKTLHAYASRIPQLRTTKHEEVVLAAPAIDAG